MTRVLLVLFLAFTLTACGGAQEEASPMDADTTAEEALTQAETQAMATPLNANDVDMEVLAAFEEIDEELAAVIVQGRPYADATELDSVIATVIPDGNLRAGIYEKVFVPVDLNTASEEAILLIPGVGERMAHEFEEYRPYVSMEQFRREIGKYVDETEVERLVGYVVIN